MLRKGALVFALAVVMLFASVGVAHAWDSIATKDGYGRVTLRAWTRNYNQVAFVADHGGTRIAVAITVDCRDGYHFDNTWHDGGSRFRFILDRLGSHGRCDHTFKVTPNSSFPLITLTIYARG